MKKPFPVVTVATTLLLLLMLLARLHLVITRAIDPDEFAHLHWSLLLVSGAIPYRDFFMNFTPIYHWILSPVFLLPQAGTTVIVARLLQYLLYIATVFIMYILSLRIAKNSIQSLLAVIIFVAFPMTFDKSLELRPDILMTLLFLAGLTVFFSTSSWTKPRARLAGALLGASFAVLLKISFAIPALLYLILRTFMTRRKLILWFFVGVAAFPIFLLLYGFAFGILGQAYENIVRGSTYLKAGEGTFSPWKSLSPYPLVYIERGGVSFPWLLNTVIFLLSAFGLLLLWRRMRSASIVFGLALLGSALFLYVFPTPYLQYFIPISALASIPASASVMWLAKRIRYPTLSKGILIATSSLLAISFFIQYRIRTGERIENTEQLGVIDSVLAVSRPDETFYDMVGSYVFRPDGHYVCCNIYSQFAHLLTPKPPTLAQSLIAKRTKFIILDRAGKVFWLPTPDDLAFLLSHYVPSTSNRKIYTVGSRFRCIRGSCVQLNVHGEAISQSPVGSFEIVVEEEYRIVTEPAVLSVLINGAPVLEEMILSPGTYRFSVSPDITSFSVALNR
jgi:hypothetical protein